MDLTVLTVYGELAPCASKEAKLAATQFWPVYVGSSLDCTGAASSPASHLSRFGAQLRCSGSSGSTSGAYRNSSVRVYPVAWHQSVRLVGCCLVTSQWRSVKLWGIDWNTLSIPVIFSLSHIQYVFLNQISSKIVMFSTCSSRKNIVLR